MLRGSSGGSAGRVRRTVREALLDVLATLVDDSCTTCESELPRTSGPTCDECRRQLAAMAAAPRCEACSEPLVSRSSRRLCVACTRRPISLRVVSVLPHAGPARRLVLALKHARRRELAWELAAIMLGDVEARAALANCDVLVAIPADPARRRARGFDQAVLLADALAAAAARDGLRVARAPRALVRRSGGAAQSSLPASARRSNVAGTLRPGYLAERSVRGRRVLLIDDVVTTGATAREAARTLRAAGAASVTVLSCTRAPRATASRVGP